MMFENENGKSCCIFVRQFLPFFYGKLRSYRVNPRMFKIDKRTAEEIPRKKVSCNI